MKFDQIQVTITLKPAVEISRDEALRAPAIFMIKLIRKVTGLHLKESKDLFESSRGFSRSDSSQESFERKLNELVQREFKFTSPALYTRDEAYFMVNNFIDFGYFRFEVVKDPNFDQLRITEHCVNHDALKPSVT